MRTDIHTESKFDPAEYKYVGFTYVGPSQDIWESMTDNGRDPEYKAAIEALHSGQAFDGNYRTKSSCDHCGVVFHYGLVYLHQPTNQYIHIGHQCGGRFSFPDRVTYLRDKAAKVAAESKKRRKIKEQAAAFLVANPGLAEILGEDRKPGEHHIIRDIAHKLWSYGSISQKQVDLVLKIDGEERTKQEEKERKQATATPCPSGLTAVRGKVVSHKHVANYTGRGSTLKFLVEDDRGFRVFGTCPSGLHDTMKGDVVEFSAEVSPSEGDAFFGFFKGPMRARILKEVVLPGDLQEQ